MGAGNPKLSSFDEEKFDPHIYFIDITEDFDQVEQRIKDETGEDPDEDQVYREINLDAEYNFEDLIESLCSELGQAAHSLNRGNGYPELSSAFREEGLILTEGKLCYVITETGAEYSHLPIAVIPNFKFEEFKESVESELWDKQDWYRARHKDWDAAVEKRATAQWDKRMKEFNKEAETILKTLHKWYGEKMSLRCGAWTSGSIEPKLLAA